MLYQTVQKVCLGYVSRSDYLHGTAFAARELHHNCTTTAPAPREVVGGRTEPGPGYQCRQIRASRHPRQGSSQPDRAGRG